MERRRKRVSLVASPLLFALLLSAYSSAQFTTDVSLTLTGAVSTNLITAVTPSTSLPKSTMVTSFRTSSAANASTTSSASSTATAKAAPPPLGITTSPANHSQHTGDGVFNYYFLFLGLFGVLVALGLWYMHKRRKIAKERLRMSGHDALARDLDGWVNTRRWMHGAWRHSTTGFVRREEGLNERGEAPPPYEPKAKHTAGQGERGPLDGSGNAVAVPSRALSTDEIESIRPPEYQEMANQNESAVSRPETAITRSTRPDTARPDTAGTRTDSSTRHFFQNQTSNPSA